MIMTTSEEHVRVGKEGGQVELDANNEITKSNYEEGIAELMDRIKWADFVAVDATVETTGFVLKNEELNPAYMGDTKDYFGVWYDNIKDNDTTHCLLEIGVAVFKRVAGSLNEIESEVYNIPLLPACIDDNEMGRYRGRNSVRIHIDGYGQEFMTSVGFDVNKPFYLAAPYLNRDLCKIADDYMKQNPTFMVGSRKRAMNPCLMPQIFEIVTEKERKVIIERLRGISKVFEGIAAAGVPVVGHNLFVKMIFMYKDFVEYLPDTYPEYLDKMREMFKLIYDTKQMAADIRGISDKFGNQLSDLKLYSLLRNINCNREMDMYTVFVSARSKAYFEDATDLCLGDIVEKDIESYCYVAGFDALVSGLVFLDLISILQLNKIDFELPSEAPSGGPLNNSDTDGDANSTEEKSEHDDYYDLFMKGLPGKFKNNLYGEPIVPTKRGELFDLMKDRKKSRRQKIEKERQSVVRATVVDGIRTLNRVGI